MTRLLISISKKGEWQLNAKERFKLMFFDLKLVKHSESYSVGISVFALMESTVTLINALI